MKLREELSSLLRDSTYSGRGRLDSYEWEERDLKEYLLELDDILRQHGLKEPLRVKPLKQS